MTVLITDYVKDASYEREVLGEKLCEEPTSDTEVLLVWHQKINDEYLREFPNLKGVVRYGVGYDAVDLDAIRDRNILFCNTPDYGTDEVSNTAVAMILNISRGVSRYDYQCREYPDFSWQENTISSLKRASKTVIGVYGAGRIGGSVCLKARALGFEVIFFDPFQDRGYEKLLGVKRAESEAELLASSDIVSLHVPLSESTRKMVNNGFIEMMKPGASLVNTARGELVADLDVLSRALRSSKLHCVSLDVLPDEPPSVEHDLIKAWRDREAWLDGRFIVNPHTAYYTAESYKEMRCKAAENALRILNDERPHNIIVDARQI